MKTILAGAALVALLTGCQNGPTAATTVQTAVTDTQTALADVQKACNVATTALSVAQAVLKGGALDTVNAVGAYVTASCSTASAIATLAANPTSVAWLNTLASSIDTTAALAKPAS